MPAVPTSLIVMNCAYRLDGGSISFEFREPDGTRHTLYVPQHSLPSNFRASDPPGALIFDGQPLAVRGSEEAALLAALRKASMEPCSSVHEGLAARERLHGMGSDISDYLAAIDQGPQAAMQHLIDQVISFVESDEYVRVAWLFGRAPGSRIVGWALAFFGALFIAGAIQRLFVGHFEGFGLGWHLLLGAICLVVGIVYPRAFMTRAGMRR